MHSAVYFLNAPIGTLIMVLLFPIPSETDAKSATAAEIPVYMISTRDTLNYEVAEGKAYGNYSFSNIAKLHESCSQEVVLYIHEWG